MFNLILENKAGDKLTFGMDSPFTISEIQGLNPPTATINTNEIALMDGALFNSSKVNMRSLNIAFAIEYMAAYNRIEVFKVLKSKQWVRMYYKSDYRDVFIDGYIQSIDISYFEMKQIVTCAILCPSPYFKNVQEVINELSAIIAMFHFPFYGVNEINNNLLENQLQDGSRNGVTAVKNADGSITLNGTASANTYLIISGNYASGRVPVPDWLHEGVTYHVSGDYVRVFFYDDNGDTIFSCNPNSDFTVPREAIYYGIFVAVMKDVSVSNVTVYPMVTVASSPQEEYEEYETYSKNIVFSYLDPVANIEVINYGDVSTGLLFELYAYNAVANIKIYDHITGEFIGVDYEMQSGDLITIDTRQGEKTITLLREGVETNIFNSLMKDSTWLQLPANGGVYTYEVGYGEPENVHIDIKHFTLYEGV